MYVEEDLLIVDEIGVPIQQVGREQTSARPVFSDPERVYCRAADPGQERLRRSDGSGAYSYADAVRDRVVFKHFTHSKHRLHGLKDIILFGITESPIISPIKLNHPSFRSSFAAPSCSDFATQQLQQLQSHMKKLIRLNYLPA
ncbi:hypothetical protein HELRODRAFT_175866 [Helobdella robusta]|uniref:Uncharacterized protein n=1 Tax=Helobdella robusta TaxID=6412 RepID=T1F9S7_HELRO|nr:hypothetical protein HELRODRAFT_175866 [Helobdella robusta]ESO00436.1 hypothetical protein HELRODRAFT_175866 [Helobdella robusta]